MSGPDSLGRRGNASSQAADAGQLVIDFDTGFLFVSGCQRLLEVFIEGFDKRALVQNGEQLRCGARVLRPDNDAPCPEAREPQKSTA
jgi:hypothetical protein